MPRISPVMPTRLKQVNIKPYVPPPKPPTVHSYQRDGGNWSSAMLKRIYELEGIGNRTPLTQAQANELQMLRKLYLTHDVKGGYGGD